MSHALKRGIYDIEKSWEQNIIEGPQFFEEIPPRNFPSRHQWKELLGFSVASPLGVPSGPLLNSRWIALASQLGYDILTYKTIRSVAVKAHPVPNVLFVDIPQQLQAADAGGVVIVRDELPPKMAKLSITNSFGNPSMSSEYLQSDLALSKACLLPGQILIASVFGTPGAKGDVADDYAYTAQLACEAGVDVIEANFSCPNVTAEEGSLYADPEEAFRIAKKIVQTIGEVPLIIKTGAFHAPAQMEEVLVALARAGVRGICGINTISMRVVDKRGDFGLSPDRPTSGICGAAIRSAAVNYVKTARAIIDRHDLQMALLGCGGITSIEHFDGILEAGAEAALTATGMMWDPLLANRWHSKRGLSYGA